MNHRNTKKREVVADGSGKWDVDTLTFETREAAEHYAKTQQFLWLDKLRPRDLKVVPFDLHENIVID